MADGTPPKDHFWRTLGLTLGAATIVWLGIALVSSAPMGANDWFGIGPLFIVPGVFCALVGLALVVVVVRRQSRD